MATGSDKNVGFDVNARDKTKRALTSAQKNLKKTSREANGLAGRFRSVARATVIMEGPLGGTAGRLSAVATMLNSTNAGAIALGVGFAGLTAGVFKSLSAFSDYERQTFKINKLLETTGNASGLTATQIELMADKIGKATLESADGVREASAVLLTFKSIAGSAFERTISVATDLAALTGQDLKQSVIQLGKALEDPATGMSALRRSGVSFTNSQKEMIVTMKEAGDVAGAQAEILKLLEGQLGGAGAAAGEGLAGSIDLVSHNWGKLLENFAKSGAGGAATEFLNQFGKGLGIVAEAVDPTMANQLNNLFEERAEILNEIREIQDNTNTAGAAGRNLQIERLKEESDLLFVQINQLASKQHGQALEARAAKEKSAEVQKQIAAEQLAERALAEEKKRIKEEEKAFEKGKTKAVSEGDKLAADLAKFENSLLSKAAAEDMYLEDRLEKIALHEEAGFLTREQANVQEQTAFALHNAKLTEIYDQENQKRLESDEKVAKVRLGAASKAFGDVAKLMNTNSKKLFKLGKLASLTQAIIDGYAAATASFKNAGGYPWGVAAAAASLVATGVQIANIKKQSFNGARQLGGPVIAGRTYLVGERGPELFTSARTGQIINNSTTNNLGGGSNTLNVTYVQGDGAQTEEEKIASIWEIVLFKMNEEGMRFS